MGKFFSWPVIIILAAMAFIFGQKFFDLGARQEAYQVTQNTKAKTQAAQSGKQTSSDCEVEFTSDNINSDNINQALACAEQGDLKAQRSLAWHYRNNDATEVIKWTTLAAEQGDKGSQNELAKYYNFGVVADKDFVEAFKWASLAAEQGGRLSQSILSVLYETGRGGVTVDLVSAYMWGSLSMGGSSKGLAGRLQAILAERMTADQITEAERLTRKWIEEHPDLE